MSEKKKELERLPDGAVERGGKTRFDGMKDRPVRPALAGRAKIGERKTKKKDGKTVEYPSALDYIKFVENGTGKRLDSVHEILGDKPTEFIAVLPSNERSSFFWQTYRLYSAAGLICHGNGVDAVVEATGEVVPCPCKKAKGDSPECKVTTSLKVVVPELPTLGVFQIDSRGEVSADNLRWFVEALGALTGGLYMGVQVRFYITPFQGKKGTNYAWNADILGTPSQTIQSAAKAKVDGDVARLIPAELLQLDEGRPIPEDLDEDGEVVEGEVVDDVLDEDEPKDAAGEAVLKEKKREAASRGKAVGWTKGKLAARYEACLHEADGNEDGAVDALVAEIEADEEEAERLEAEAQDVFDV